MDGIETLLEEGDGEVEDVGVDEGVIEGVGVVDGVPLGVTVGDDEGDELAPILRDDVGVTVGDGDEDGVGEGEGEAVGVGEGDGEALGTLASGMVRVTQGCPPFFERTTLATKRTLPVPAAGATHVPVTTVLAIALE
jgi:hypothetical protein